jgi:hypothetical protein
VARDVDEGVSNGAVLEDVDVTCRGSCMVTELAMFAPAAAQLMFDVAGSRVALLGRIDDNSFVDGRIMLTLRATGVAVEGAISALIGAVSPGGWVATVPVICIVWGTPDTNGLCKPTSVRVSRMRVGVIDTNDDGAFDAALTATKPLAPNATATAAPKRCPTRTPGSRTNPRRTRRRALTFRLSARRETTNLPDSFVTPSRIRYQPTRPTDPSLNRRRGLFLAGSTKEFAKMAR